MDLYIVGIGIAAGLTAVSTHYTFNTSQVLASSALIGLGIAISDLHSHKNKKSTNFFITTVSIPLILGGGTFLINSIDKKN